MHLTLTFECSLPCHSQKAFRNCKVSLTFSIESNVKPFFLAKVSAKEPVYPFIILRLSHSSKAFLSI